MKINLDEVEIVERSSGFWIVDKTGTVCDKPFDSVEEANTWLSENHDKENED